MSKFTIDIGSIICKPIAVYIVALELNVNFWMLMLATILFLVNLTFTKKW